MTPIRAGKPTQPILEAAKRHHYQDITDTISACVEKSLASLQKIEDDLRAAHSQVFLISAPSKHGDVVKLHQQNLPFYLKIFIGEKKEAQELVTELNPSTNPPTWYEENYQRLKQTGFFRWGRDNNPIIERVESKLSQKTTCCQIS